MIRTVSLLALMAVLGACGDGQPLFPDGNPTDPTGPEVPLLPEDIAGNVTSAQYVAPTADSPDGSLRVQIQSLDSTPAEVEYARNEALDVGGFDAYSVQEDPLDRYFVGLGRASTDGVISGAVVADGGQFNRYFGGVDIQRNAAYSAYQPSQPDRGLVSYAGEYAGLLNVSINGQVPPGTDPELIPGRPVRVAGEVFINADFTDNAVNGAITDRRTIEGNIELLPVIMAVTDIKANGTFAGTAEDPEQAGIGTFAGAFGGTGATAVAGGTYLQEHIEGFENVEERGLFVLTRCGLDGDDRICDGVDPGN